MRQRRAILLFLLLALAILGAGAAWDYLRFLKRPLHVAEAEGLLLDVPRGSNLRTLAAKLASDGVLSRPGYLLALAQARGQLRQIKAGEYLLTPGITPRQLLDLLVSGRSVQFAVTIVEGWTFRQALAAIAEQPAFISTLSGLSDRAIIERLDLDIEHPEGWFFPDTYHFDRGTSDREVLLRAHRRMREILDAEWAERAPDLPLNDPYEALILASIIEKETGLPSERGAIAGVFIRRLQRRMRLQTDPTVIYGLGADFSGRLRRADLDRDTPYNTYRRDGLPPTPIALPGRAAIHAALHPESDTTLYFVSRGDGSHYFSASLPEHNCAVRRYQLGRDCDPRRYRLGQ